VLLLGGDRTAALFWADQFQGNVLAFAALLLVAGSLAGMLIQELGDLIEKGLWLIPWLDPKFYAANAVNSTDLAKVKEKVEKHTCAEPGKGKRLLAQFFSAVAALLVVGCAVALLPVAIWTAAAAADDAVWFEPKAMWGLWPLGIMLLAALLLRPKVDFKDDAIKTVRDANPYLQTCLVGHGNTSKRTLFDGWRFVMRNLILVLSVTNLVSLWKPVDLYHRVAHMLVGKGGDMTGHLFWLIVATACVVSLMLVRYYHYAYLRYKYSLENYIHMITEAEEAKAKGATP
jgi:hypothetical protein